MLGLLKVLVCLISLVFASNYLTVRSAFVNVLHLELILVLFVAIIWTLTSFLNSVLLLGLGLIYLLLGSLELALSILLILL